MTYAPARLFEVRHYLQPITGLPDAQLGIVGDISHVGGYHHGWDQRAGSSDYSWVESGRDSSHKTNAARALDVGMFDRMREMSVWLAAECAKGAPDTLDIREVIYSPDGVTVERWDRLGRRTSGDDSHRTHTHISWFADAEDRDKTAVFKRFFGDDEMTPEQATMFDDLAWRVDALWANTDLRGGRFKTDPALNHNGLKAALAGLSVPELSDEQLAAIAIQAGEHAAALIGGKLDAVLAALAANRTDARDAVADLGEGGAAQVRADED
jgi:hypothetical protein